MFIELLIPANLSDKAGYVLYTTMIVCQLIAGHQHTHALGAIHKHQSNYCACLCTVGQKPENLEETHENMQTPGTQTGDKIQTCDPGSERRQG